MGKKKEREKCKGEVEKGRRRAGVEGQRKDRKTEPITGDMKIQGPGSYDSTAE